MLRVERLADPDAMTALIPEWEALDRTLAPRTPFTAPLWNILWWRHLREQRLFCRDDFAVHVVRDEDGALVAVAPMMITQRPGVGPAGVRELQFFGADPNLTEVRGLACRAEDQDAVIRALTGHLLMKGRGWDWIKWMSVRRDQPAYDWLERAGRLQLRRDVPCYHLALPDSWEAFRGQLPRNIKESLRKCYNSLKRDGHAFEFRVVTAPGAVDAALERFFALHGARADAEGSVHHNDVFATPRARAFLTDYAREMAARDQLRIFQIAVGDLVVATRIGFLLGTDLYLYYSGYEPSWGKYSIMTTVVAEAFQWAIANGVKVANLSTGTDVSKTRWRPTELVVCDGVQVAPTRRGQLAFRVYSDLLRQSGSDSLVGRLIAQLRRQVRAPVIHAPTQRPE